MLKFAGPIEPDGMQLIMGGFRRNVPVLPLRVVLVVFNFDRTRIYG
jgi:hypothetical protein